MLPECISLLAPRMKDLRPSVSQPMYNVRLVPMRKYVRYQYRLPVITVRIKEASTTFGHDQPGQARYKQEGTGDRWLGGNGRLAGT